MTATPCTADPDLWFNESRAEHAAALCVALDCPLLDACRKLGESERWGVWGGVNRGPQYVPPRRHVNPPGVIAARYAGQPCRNGHERTPENTRVRVDDGTTVCRECANDRNRRRKARARQSVAA